MDISKALNEIFYGRSKNIKYFHKRGKVAPISIYQLESSPEIL